MALLRVRTQLALTGGNPLLSTAYFEDTGYTAQDAADAVAGFWNELAADLSANLTGAVETDVAVIDPSTGGLVGSHSTLATTPIVGGGSGNDLPTATQGLIRWNTGTVMHGRFLKGRWFIPGCTEDHSTNGVPDSYILGKMHTAAVNFLAATDHFAVWSRPVATGPHARAGDLALVTGTTTWSQWAVLRSRRD